MCSGRGSETEGQINHMMTLLIQLAYDSSPFYLYFVTSAGQEPFNIACSTNILLDCLMDISKDRIIFYNPIFDMKY